MAALVLIVLQLVSFILFISRLKNVDRVIAEDIVLTSQWSEIKLHRPLRASQRPQFISLDVKKDRHEAVALPEIQLIDEYGSAYDLHTGKVTDSGNSIVIPYDLNKDSSFTKDKTFALVRIRSDARVQCNKIIWRYRI